MKITNQIIESHGLSTDEFENIKKLLNREPNILELGIFSAMWNEHCSYKSSRLHLKKLPTRQVRLRTGHAHARRQAGGAAAEVHL